MVTLNTVSLERLYFDNDDLFTVKRNNSYWLRHSYRYLKTLEYHDIF